MFSNSYFALGALACATQVAAHGFVQGITVNGVYSLGANPSFKFQNPLPTIAGWMADNIDNGFVSPDAYTSDNITCHKAATNGKTSIKVAAGDEIQLHWNTWPDSHHGPVIDYLASCDGDCTTVDKTTLKFNKIKAAGLIDASKGGQTGYWATDELIANNFTWVTTIPESIAAGSYVLRHEIIALHSAGDVNGAQNYPQCINFEVTSSGSNKLAAGTLGPKLYTPTDAGIKVSIYPPSGYTIPGPALISGGDSSAEPSAGSGSSSATASAPAASASSASAAAPVSTSEAATIPAPVSTSEPATTPAAGNTATVSAPTTLVTKASPTAAAPTTPAESSTPDDGDDDTCI